MDGGDANLADKLRRLLAYMGVGFAASVTAEFVISFLEAGGAERSGSGTEIVIRQVTQALIAIASGLLILGSLALLVRRQSARRTLLCASIILLAATAGLLSLQVSYAMRPSTETSWQVVVRQAQNWTVKTGALPLLLIAFVGWPELIPQPSGSPGGIPEHDGVAEQPSLATRLMRVLSVYGVVFGGTSLAVLVYLALTTHGMGIPDLRPPVSVADAFQQLASVLEWLSGILMIVGATGELLRRKGGRHFLLIAAALWLVGTLCSFAWSVLIDATTTRAVRTMSAQMSDDVVMLLGKLEQCVYPVMLLVCLSWRELRPAASGENPAGFPPILSQSPNDTLTDGSQGSAEDLA